MNLLVDPISVMSYSKNFPNSLIVYPGEVFVKNITKILRQLIFIQLI